MDGPCQRHTSSVHSLKWGIHPVLREHAMGVRCHRPDQTHVSFLRIQRLQRGIDLHQYHNNSQQIREDAADRNGDRHPRTEKGFQHCPFKVTLTDSHKHESESRWQHFQPRHCLFIKPVHILFFMTIHTLYMQHKYNLLYIHKFYNSFGSFAHTLPVIIHQAVPLQHTGINTYGIKFTI